MSSSVGWVIGWLPDSSTVWKELAAQADPEELRRIAELSEFEGMKFTWKPEYWRHHWFDPSFWIQWTSRNWQIPITAVILYFIAIGVLKFTVMKYGKWNVRNFTFFWNAGLSIFSWCGVFACVPVLIGSFAEHGLYFTSCAPSSWYGHGMSGFFVAIFIYSKVFELMDTILLVLAGKPVIALQWWHHSTVLLYCWHSYSNCIATGLWFAAMNYCVHAIMYGYFAIAITSFRKYVTPFAMCITIAQLAQMVVGMLVTAWAVMYHASGKECHLNKTNTVMGLLMYFSYFVLFSKLFIDSYITRSRKRSADVSPASSANSKANVQSGKAVNGKKHPQNGFEVGTSVSNAKIVDTKKEN